MGTGMPLTVVTDLTDIGSVSKDDVQLATGEFRLSGNVFDPFGLQCIGQAIQCVTVICVEVVDSSYCVGILLVDLNDATTIHSDIAISVGRATSKQPTLYPAINPLSHVDGLLAALCASLVSEE